MSSALARLYLRFDLRCPDFAGHSLASYWRAALDMCVWAEQKGFEGVLLSEHHSSDDSYLCSPIVFGAAILGRTRQLRLQLSALIAPLYDPVRLAEDLAVLDRVGEGRLEVVLGAGYLPREFAMFGRQLRQRGRLTEECVSILRQAWSGERFDYQGRPCRVRPGPFQPGGPKLLLGATMPPGARRAARVADGIWTGDPELYQVYREECLRLEKPDPGPWVPISQRIAVVDADVESSLEQVAPFLLHDLNSYARWGHEASGAETEFQPLEDVRALMQPGAEAVCTPQQCLDLAGRLGEEGYLLLEPLYGGIAPERGWRSLRCFEGQVLEPLRRAGQVEQVEQAEQAEQRGDP